MYEAFTRILAKKLHYDIMQYCLVVLNTMFGCEVRTSDKNVGWKILYFNQSSEHEPTDFHATDLQTVFIP